MYDKQQCFMTFFSSTFEVIEIPSSVVKDKCDFHVDFHLVLFTAFKNEMGLEPIKIFFRETFFHEKANYRKFSQKKSNEAI